MINDDLLDTIEQDNAIEGKEQEFIRQSLFVARAKKVLDEFGNDILIRAAEPVCPSWRENRRSFSLSPLVKQVEKLLELEYDSVTAANLNKTFAAAAPDQDDEAGLLGQSDAFFTKHFTASGSNRAIGKGLEMIEKSEPAEVLALAKKFADLDLWG